MQKHLETITQARQAKLISCQAEYDVDSLTWYLYLIYRYEANDGAYELHIPKFVLSNVLPINHMPVINILRNRYKEIANITTHNDGHVLLQPCSTISLEHMDTGDYDTYKDVYFAVRQVSEKKPVEMTLEEIEKKLGYKVKVVSEKQEVK